MTTLSGMMTLGTGLHSISNREDANYGLTMQEQIIIIIIIIKI